MKEYWPIFYELIVTPFRHAELIWGIVPLYFGWLLNEMTSKKASFHTAVQTGFGLLWAGAHWAYRWRAQFAGDHHMPGPNLTRSGLLAVNLVVTILVIAIGAVALVSGLRRKFPAMAHFWATRASAITL